MDNSGILCSGRVSDHPAAGPTEHIYVYILWRFIQNYRARSVVRKPLELPPTYGVLLSIISDAGGEIVAEGDQSLGHRVGMQIYHGPADRPHSQGAVERVGGVAS